MANPALKNGYISIATELVEKLATISIPSSEMRVIWVVWRKTWGWQSGDRKKDWDWISLSQFEKMTTMKHGNVAKSVKSLVVKRILLREENRLKFNQNYNEWVVVKRLPPVVKRILPSSQTHTGVVVKRLPKVVVKRIPTIDKIDTNTIDTNTKEIANSVRNDLNPLIALFEKINPTTNYGNKTQRKALDELIEKLGYEKTTRTIEYAVSVQGKQYAPTITTPLQLKEKLSQLLIYYQKESTKGNKYKAVSV